MCLLLISKLNYSSIISLVRSLRPGNAATLAQPATRSASPARQSVRLAVRAALVLLRAQELYLPRDEAFRFDGARAADCGPHIRFHLDGVGVGFELDRAALNDQHLAHYQVAHEIIHMLAPDRHETGAIMLEEGLATHFSIYGPDFENPGYRQTLIDWFHTPEAPTNYRDALAAFEKLNGTEPNAIILLRKKEPNFTP
jgi:hypothetical protein